MAVIKPTLSLTANSNTVTTNPGPMSFALALSVTDSVTVDVVEQELITTSTTLAQLLDGADVGGATKTVGVVGCYIYLKNGSTTSAENIMVAIVGGGTLAAANSGTAAGTASPLAPAASGTSALDATDNKTNRTFTLKAGEFAFFPFDYTGDIYYESASGTPTLEYWRFDR